MSLTFAKNWSKCLIHLENKVIKISEKKQKCLHKEEQNSILLHIQTYKVSFFQDKNLFTLMNKFWFISLNCKSTNRSIR